MSSQEVVARKAAFIEQGTQFEDMLKEWGLPSENIIASADERIRLVENLPSLMATIPVEQRQNATYLSRFVAGASHPNSYDIQALELLGWLQTCVSEVITDKPSDSAVRIKEIIEGLKTSSEPIKDSTIKSIGDAVAKFSSSMAETLLRSLFGLFVADNTSVDVRANILKLSKEVWDYCNEDVKVDLGEKKLYYLNSLQTAKEELAYKFLENCNGLSYLSITDRSLT